MSWTTPSTATAGSTLTAALWNQQVRDNMTDLGQPGVAFAIMTASQSIAHQASETYSQFANVDSLTYSKNTYIAVASQLRFSVGGLWEVTAGVKWPATAAATGTSFRAAKLYPNGSASTSRDMRPNVQNVDTVCICPPILTSYAAGSFVGVGLWQNSGGSLSIQAEVFIYARLIYR